MYYGPSRLYLGGDGVADRAGPKRGSEARVERGGDRATQPLETRTPGPKDLIGEVRREGGGDQLPDSGGAAH